MVDHILEAWAEDISVRLVGGEPSIAAAYEVRVKEFVEGPVFSDENVRVIAFKVSHGKWQRAFGFRFETADQVIVVSGDTTFDENLIAHAEGCNVLIHEAYSAQGLSVREPEWQLYHSTYHTSGPDLGRLASRVKPDLVLLYHMLPFGQSREQILEEVRSEFKGKVRIARDLMRI
jgi:ribonuclease Z